MNENKDRITASIFECTRRNDQEERVPTENDIQALKIKSVEIDKMIVKARMSICELKDDIEILSNYNILVNGNISTIRKDIKMLMENLDILDQWEDLDRRSFKIHEYFKKLNKVQVGFGEDLQQFNEENFSRITNQINYSLSS